MQDELQAIQALANLLKATGPMAEKIRKALQTSVKVDYKETHFSDILKDLQKKAPDISFRILYLPEVIEGGTVHRDPALTLHFEKPLPIAAVLQALEDSLEIPTKDRRCCFVVRDYGILVTTQGLMPPEALTVSGIHATETDREITG